MAFQVSAAGVTTLVTTYTGASAIALGDAQKGVVSRWLVVVRVVSGSFSMTFKGVISPLKDGTRLAVAVYGDGLAYRRVTDITDTASSTAVTASGNYIVYADGQDLYLDIATNSGSAEIYAEPMAG